MLIETFKTHLEKYNDPAIPDDIYIDGNVFSSISYFIIKEN